MPIKIATPWPFGERLLAFGGGGAGKTTAILSIARHLKQGVMHVLDADDSSPYQRALATDYADCADRVNVIRVANDWDKWTAAFAKMLKAARSDHDWIVPDSISGSYDSVQNYASEAVHGHDLATHMLQLKQQFPNDPKGYQKALSNSMNWPWVKKEYQQRVWGPLAEWQGHVFMTAEAKSVSKDADAEEKMIYGPIGYKPNGQGRINHVMSTNLFFAHPAHGRWEFTTVKDRNREEVDRRTYTEFAIDYLVGIAGWERAR